MVFNRKGSFFLNLGGDRPGQAVTVAPVAPVPGAGTAESEAAASGEPSAPKSVASPTESAAAAPPAAATGLTTAEAIAAELRRDQENRPAPSTVTFAADLLSPSGALPQPRRRAGANLAGFKAMADSLIRN